MWPDFAWYEGLFMDKNLEYYCLTTGYIKLLSGIG